MPRPTEDTVDHRYAPQARAGGWVLVVAREGRSAFVVRLPERGTVRIGRGDEAELCLRSPSLSRLHLAIDFAGDACAARDLGSRNGSLLGGAKLGSEPREVGAGDEIVAGDLRLVLLPASTQPATVRPFDLLSALETRAIADADAHLAAFELERPVDEDPELLELLAKLPESTTFALASSDALVLLAHDEASLRWFERALDRPSRAPRRTARGRTMRGSASLSELLRALERADDTGAEAPIPPAFRYPSMLAVHASLRRIAPRALSVLIHGETGTGKEVVARELHRLSGRAGPLVAVNAAALPESLIESELFGYEKGAFSGAQAAKAGLIEASDGGTLFLDEIGELQLSLPAKLLRVLEDRQVRRLGALREKAIDLRIVAATHRDLERLVSEGSFRRDLLYRVQAADIELPPLRERRGEVAALAKALLLELAPNEPLVLSDAAAHALETHDWPGNVRELKHVLERAVAFVDGSVLDLEHLPANIRHPEPRRADAPRADATAGDVRTSVKDFERERIVAALREAGGNRTRAAELLGLPRRTLVYKISKLRITEA